MESSGKMPWHSSTIALDSSATGSQASVRSTWSSQAPPAHENPLSEILSGEMAEKMKVLSRVMDETLAENVSLEKDILAFLETIDLLPDSLSPETQKGLEIAGAILNKYDLSDFDETALVVSVERQKREKLAEARKDRALKKKYEELCTQYDKVQKKVNKVQEKVNSLAEVIEKSRGEYEQNYSEDVHNAMKLNDYKRAVENLEKELADMNVSDIGPDVILAKYDRYMGACGELAELTKSLSLYGDLPPDIRQAKAVLEQTEKRRLEVKQLLEKKMGQ